jgi:CRISPR-associated protein Csx17
MNSIRLAGCRTDSLLGYLKAIGVLRLLAMQRESESRASWRDDALEILTVSDRIALENFFLEDYAPTPILNPWNNGAGFDGKQDTAGTVVQRLRETKHARWLAYRTTLKLIDQQFVSNGLRESLGKDDLVQALRAQYSDEALSWLDAAIVIGREKSSFPYLLGSGGNDGRLDFSVNFAARALDVIGDAPLKDRRALLRDAFDDTSSGSSIADVAIGQFGPRFAGGVNATTGFDSVSLVNPWDLVLALEGAIAFTGGLAKRCPSGGESVTFPFAFRLVPGGYASASSDEVTRGELWLPVWSGNATYRAVSTMLRAGRADLPSGGDQPQVKTALDASQAAQAALALGASTGVERFERIMFSQRNGLAYTATHSGVVHTGADESIALLSRGSAAWIERVRRQNFGGAVHDALRRFDSSIFAYAQVNSARKQSGPDPRHSARQYQDILIALASVEYAIARRGSDEMGPLPLLDSQILEALDDGRIEHRVAAAVNSLGFASPDRWVRLHLEHVRHDERGRLQYWPDARVLLLPSAAQTLGAILEWRSRMAESNGIEWMQGVRGIAAWDAALLAEGELDHGRLLDLIVAYSLVRPSVARDDRDNPGSDAETPAAAFALIKLVLDHPKACDHRIVSLLRARQPARAIELALQRARSIENLPGPPRSVFGTSVRHPEWYAAAALVPISPNPSSYGPLLRAALTRAPSPESLHDYLKSLRPDKESKL